MEVCKRTEPDKKGGPPVLLEVAQVNSNDYNNFTNITKFTYFNTNNFWIKFDDLFWESTNTDEIKNDFDLYIISNKKRLTMKN